MENSKNNYKKYKIIGAYDSETSNYINDNQKVAYPILHQLGLINVDINKITSENVEKETRIYLYRHTEELYESLTRIINSCVNYVPVICCHNLAFDMYALAPLLMRYDTDVLAKSMRKPITFTVNDENGNPKLVLWDTLVFSQKSLSYMGSECGYSKLVGAWDYNLIRTPETSLTDEEVAYAKHDIYALLAWLGYWCRLNPEIKTSDLAYRVVTKTGIVRTKRLQRFKKLRGIKQKKTVGKYWSSLNKANEFKSDDELYTAIASTRGGLTFVASENASKVFDLDEDSNESIIGYDATSQHPAQIISHRYPVNFKKSNNEDLTRAYKIIESHLLEDVLKHYEKPFPVAFYGCFKFKNLRLKKDSLFEKFGIAPLASARCKEHYQINNFTLEENQDQEEFREHLANLEYKDKVKNPKYQFGKLVSADDAELFITELTAWEISQCYDYDSVEALSGYLTLSFDKPSDMAVLSVMNFYKAKNEFKKAQENYYKNKRMTNKSQMQKCFIPNFIIEGMENRTIDDNLIKATYLGLKADLNALFGIEASNEYRRDTALLSEGIGFIGEFGICNAPEQPKAHYQMGARIVGWSRIAQIIVMQLVEPYIKTIINGDTDSLKFLVDKNKINDINKSLNSLNQAIDKAKLDVCTRIKECYPSRYNELKEIGYYIQEFATKQFCASWNKAYVIRANDKCNFTIAGIPASRKFEDDKLNINQLADYLIDKQGWSFGQICDTFLGYNVTYANDITSLNARSFPKWSEIVDIEVKDYLGNVAKVKEPASLCLYPMSKIINDTRIKDNKSNLEQALKNRNSINQKSIIIKCNEVIDVEQEFKIYE